jgi:hypothetical protein
MSSLIRPARVHYILPLLVLLVGSLAAYRAFSARLTAIGGELSGIAVPGERVVAFPRSGHHTVFVELRGAGLNRLLAGRGPEGLVCTIRPEAGGEPLPLQRSWLRVQVALPERRGVSLYDFSVRTPGQYRVAVSYADADTTPGRIVLIGEGVFGDLRREVLLSLGVPAAAMAAGIAGIIVVFLMRERSKKWIYGRFGSKRR